MNIHFDDVIIDANVFRPEFINMIRSMLLDATIKNLDECVVGNKLDSLKLHSALCSNDNVRKHNNNEHFFVVMHGLSDANLATIKSEALLAIISIRDAIRATLFSCPFEEGVSKTLFQLMKLYDNTNAHLEARK